MFSLITVCIHIGIIGANYIILLINFTYIILCNFYWEKPKDQKKPITLTIN